MLSVGNNYNNAYCYYRDLLDRHGVCIRVLGDLTRLPRDVQEAVARAMKLTRIHNKFVNRV